MAKLHLIFIVSSAILSGCAFAPLKGEHTARTLDRGTHGIEMGFSPAPYAQYSHGATDDFEIGMGVEAQIGLSIYAFGKYGLIQKSQGLSLAAVGGAGFGLSIINTKFVHIGPVFSYRHDDLEFYFHPRVNYLMYDGFSTDNDDDNLEGFNFDGGSFSYFQFNAGGQYWVTERFAFGLGIVAAPQSPKDSIEPAIALNLLMRVP